MRVKKPKLAVYNDCTATDALQFSLLVYSNANCLPDGPGYTSCPTVPYGIEA